MKKKEKNDEEWLEEHAQCDPKYDKMAEEIGNGWFEYRLVEVRKYWKNKNIDNGKKHYTMWIEMREVYFDQNGEIWAFTANPTKLYFNTLDDMKFYIKAMKRAKRKNVLRLEKKGKKETLVDTGMRLKDYTYDMETDLEWEIW